MGGGGGGGWVGGWECDSVSVCVRVCVCVIDICIHVLSSEINNVPLFRIVPLFLASLSED